MGLFGYQFGFMSKPPSASGSGPLPGFDFASVGSLELWLDARDASTITESGSLVSSWANRIPAKPVTAVTQATMIDRPVYSPVGAYSGVSTVRFNGGTANTSLVANASPVTTGPVFIYTLVERYTSPGTTMGAVHLYDTGMVGGSWELDLNSTYNGTFTTIGAVTATTSNIVSTGVQAHILFGQQEPPIGDTVTVGIDGGSSSTLSMGGFPTTNATVIGNAASLGAPFGGAFSIILVYSALSSAEQTQVIGGLASIGSVP